MKERELASLSNIECDLYFFETPNREGLNLFRAWWSKESRLSECFAKTYCFYFSNLYQLRFAKFLLWISEGISFRHCEPIPYAVTKNSSDLESVRSIGSMSWFRWTRSVPFLNRGQSHFSICDALIWSEIDVAISVDIPTLTRQCPWHTSGIIICSNPKAQWRRLRMRNHEAKSFHEEYQLQEFGHK
jgi:hypothetical protein